MQNGKISGLILPSLRLRVADAGDSSLNLSRFGGAIIVRSTPSRIGPGRNTTQFRNLRHHLFFSKFREQWITLLQRQLYPKMAAWQG